MCAAGELQREVTVLSPQELPSEAIISTEVFAGPVLNPAVISPVSPLTLRCRQPPLQDTSVLEERDKKGLGKELLPLPQAAHRHTGAAPAPERWAGRVRSAPQAMRASSAHTSQFIKGSQGQIPCVTIHTAPPLGIL